MQTVSKFQDGTPFDAAAAIKSFERRRDRGLILSYMLAKVVSQECCVGRSHGFTSATPMLSKSLTLRVTSVIRRVKAVAAI